MTIQQRLDAQQALTRSWASGADIKWPDDRNWKKKDELVSTYYFAKLERKAAAITIKEERNWSRAKYLERLNNQHRYGYNNINLRKEFV